MDKYIEDKIKEFEKLHGDFSSCFCGTSTDHKEFQAFFKKALQDIESKTRREMIKKIKRRKVKTHCILHKKNFLLCINCERLYMHNRLLDDLLQTMEGK